MGNLRLNRIRVADSTTIKAEFNNSLNSLINSSNITVTSNIFGVPDAEVLKVLVNDNLLTIKTRPLTPSSSYNVEFKSSAETTFKSRDGQNFLFEDGKNNVSSILGAENPDNPIRGILTDYLKDNIYNLDDQTLVRDIINSQAANLAKALYDIRQSKNDNYIEVTIENERKTRGAGPFDRLNEEGAFEVIRVGRNKANSTSSEKVNFDAFPKNQITLLNVTVSNERLFAGTGISTFNGLVLTVAKNPVTILNSLKIIYQIGGTANYDISQFGYQINEPKYDPDHASTLVTLEDNQFRLSQSILEQDSSFVPPAAGDQILITYQYKLLGKIINEDSVVVSQVLESTREIIQPLFNKFTLQHAPIVNSNDTIFDIYGATFLDPLADPPFSDIHPAFSKEIKFKLEGLPAAEGEYAINYESGDVYVYGADAKTKDGSGNFPPIVTYNYRNVFSSNLDYTYNPETSDLVASPLRELIGQEANISFDYEQTFIPEVDFKAQVHQEILNERINNNLKNLGSLGTINTPITNVFRVFNETSGEIYTINRFNDNTVFFSYNNPPRILDINREKVSFSDILNELLIVENELINGSSIRIYKIILLNNDIINATEDAVGTSFNSSVSFSQTNIFNKEIYYNDTDFTVDENIDRLNIGEYQIDYIDGIIYVAVSNDQNLDIGTVNYKKFLINTKNSHIISISNLYHSISFIKGVAKNIDYNNFTDHEVLPSLFNVSNERFLNNDTTLPYIVDNGEITVTDDIKEVRGIYDVYDLSNNLNSTNFSSNVSISGNKIILSSSGIQKKETLIIDIGNEITVTFISPGAEIISVNSVIRISDGIELWNNTGSIADYTIFLPGIGSPSSGEEVFVIYNVQLNGGATPVVDYNRGDYYIDYSYLADEILVSYEYGDNVIDFRESSALNEGEEYFVTYKMGALRDSLLKNFGTLIDIPIVNSFDTSLDRENYRNSLQAALQSFTKGPTIPAIKELVSTITKITPELIESIFEVWSLGISNLFFNPIETTGTLNLLSGKFDNGVLIENSDETITFPVSSNLKLETGSLGMWVIPEWNGLDNDATLTFKSLIKDGYLVDSSSIFIGSDSHNPIFDSNGEFQLNRTDESSPIGLPSAIYTQTGLFIYYDDIVKRWNFLAKDYINSIDGYVYSGEITSSGEMYDVKYIEGLGENTDILRSFTNRIEFEFNIDSQDTISPDGYSTTDGYQSGFSFDGITFMADDLHYFFDFGKDNTDRFSLYKDGKGYLNFEIWDKGNKDKKNVYRVSADISSWMAGKSHLIGASWKLNSSDHRDEMHLFIDGVETPNIMRYGGRPIASLTDRFRTVKPEIIVGTIPKKTILGNDLVTEAGSDFVYSNSVNFQSEGILAGDTIDILEVGFGSYNILSVSLNTLTLDSTVPSTFNDARFSVNEFSAVVESEIDLASNIAVSILSGSIETEIPGLRADLPSYSISKNGANQNVLTLLGNADVGDQVVIRTLGLNHRRYRDRVFVWGNTTSILKTQLPPPINLDEVKIYSVLLPLTVIGPDNSTLSLGNFISDPLSTSQPSNATEGRTLAVRISGSNINFSTPATVEINGTTQGGPIIETLTFTQSETQNTTEKWETISSVIVTVTPINTTKNSASVEIKEAFSITDPEDNSIFPVIRFSFKTQNGTTLEGDGSSVISDDNGLFADSDVGNKLVIVSPAPVAGTYTITARIDENTIAVDPVPAASFTNGIYNVYNVSIGRSGFQNGFFTLEIAGQTNVPFLLNEGYFEFDYSSYLEIPFNPVSSNAFVGSDINGTNQAKAIIDEFRILSNVITDIRIGESAVTNQKSFTTDFSAIREFEPDKNTLMLLRFNNFPFVNEAPFYISSTKEFVQSSSSINENFNQSIVITDKPLIIDNEGLLSTSSDGTIEFWVSPRFDTYNDPNVRFYFDASGSIIEELISTTNGTVQLNNSISSIISVRLATDSNNTGKDYFAGGSIASDFKTINLAYPLPSQQTPVKVNYIPAGLSGDRISIYKDSDGFISFDVRADGIDYQVRQPVFWARDSWHRIRATYKFNSSNNRDEIRLFIDGEERGIILFGTGLVFGESTIFGQGLAGLQTTRLISDINFNDPINQFFIGSDYFQVHTAQARIDNLKISNIIQPLITIAGQTKDVNYSSNLDVVNPVIPDAFTTYLIDFDKIIQKANDFAILRDEEFGIFNFTLNILDSFGIVLDNAKLKQILEALILALKPAQSKVAINYIV
jgi:hypothetical protein